MNVVFSLFLFCHFKEAATQASEFKESCNYLEVIGIGRSQGGGQWILDEGSLEVQGSVALMVVFSRVAMPRYQLQ